MTRHTEEEISREARRVLRRLASPRQALLARGEALFAVARGPAGLKTSRVTVGGDVVAAFAREGWIAPDGPGRYVMAEAGAAFLARSLGGEDKFAGQHRLMEERTIGLQDPARPDSLVKVRVNAGESPLARLRFRDLIDAIQFAAGEKLRRDFTLGQLTPRMGVDLTAPVMTGGGGGEQIGDIALAARQRFNRALASVGPGLSDLLFDVCCHLTALESAEARRGWSKRSGRVVLKLALDRLAAHYGLDKVANAGSIRRWSAPAEDSA